MSTAVIEAPVPVEQAQAFKVIETTVRSEAQAPRLVDEHPFVVVGIFIAISMAAASAFVGSILFWLAIRNSGVAGVSL
jgi:hypothetical protein